MLGSVCLLAFASPLLAEEKQPVPFIAQEIHFVSEKAGEVVLVWGIDGWKTVPEARRPTGTTIRKGVMHTPMIKRDGYFTATLIVPPDTLLDFGFLITRTNSGVDVQVWEADGKDTFQRKSNPQDVITVHSKSSLLQSGKVPPDSWTWWPYVTITILCVVLPLRVAVLIVRRRHRKWHRRILLPTFEKPPRPTRTGDGALIGLSLMVGLALAELILHTIDPDGGFGAARPLDWVRTGGQDVDRSAVVDPVLGLRPRLNYGPYNDYGTVINTYSTEKSPDRIRILVLGSQAVFEGRLVEAIRQNYPGDGNRVEVWNGGVASFGAMQTIDFYKAYQSRLDPDKVILVMGSADLTPAPITYRDGRQNIVALVPYSSRTSLNSFLFTYSHLYRLLVGMRTLMGDPEETILREIQTGLTELAASLKRDRKELLVVSLPLLFPEEMWSAAEKKRHAAMLEMLGRTDIPHVDLLPAFRAALDEKLDVRQHAGNPFEPTSSLAKRFASYLQEHSLGQTIDAKIRH